MNTTTCAHVGAPELVSAGGEWCHGCGRHDITLVTVCGTYQQVADHNVGSFACRDCLLAALAVLDAQGADIEGGAQ